VKNPVVSWASRLQFPKLLFLTGGLFLADLVVPDIIPFVDEILLGLTTLVLASIRKRRGSVVETSGTRQT
jgi:hypothetical protein